MILLKFTHSEAEAAYHLFETLQDLTDYLRDNYDNVSIYEADGIACMDFDEMRMYARIINPVSHKL